MKSAFAPTWHRGNKVLNLLRNFKGNTKRKRSNEKGHWYGLSSSLCPYTNICLRIIVNENSPYCVQPLQHLSIFLKLATFSKTSTPDVAVFL